MGYTHREWNGLLGDFYYMRWNTYFKYLADTLNGKNPQPIDFYALEEAWTLQHNPYKAEAEGDAIEAAKSAYEIIK